MGSITPQQRILHVLEGGHRTWEALKGLANINDQVLGFTIGELLDQRKIWTTHDEGVRVYGVERRKGLVPRAFRRSRHTDALIERAKEGQ